MVVLFWIPIGAIVTIIFHPTLDTMPWTSVVFAFSLVGAYLIRSLFLWVLGLVTIWTTRVSALF